MVALGTRLACIELPARGKQDAQVSLGEGSGSQRRTRGAERNDIVAEYRFDSLIAACESVADVRLRMIGRSRIPERPLEKELRYDTRSWDKMKEESAGAKCN